MVRATSVLFCLLVLVLRKASGQLNLVAFDIHAPIAPAPVTALGAHHFIYELRITNIGSKDRALDRVEIFADQGRATPLLVLSGDSLKHALRPAGAPLASGDDRIPTGRQSLLYLFVTVPDGQPLPHSLQHRFIVTPADSVQSARRDTLDGFTVNISSTPVPLLRAPISGGPWVAGGGPSNVSGHRRTVIPLEGSARIAQRFATDWVKLGPDGLPFHGDSTINANWYDYGTPVVAVADGVITETKDGIIENVPMSPTMAVPITLETVAGNHVILDLGNGSFGLFAHLQPGSLKVKRGDRVKRGQAIGLLGNSGNSTAPHLHFHVGNRSSPLGSEGTPFEYERFELLEQLPAGDIEDELTKTGWKEKSGPRSTRVREIPLENAIVRFP